MTDLADAARALRRAFPMERIMHPMLSATLRDLYGDDLIDRLEAAPPLGTPAADPGPDPDCGQPGDARIVEYDAAEQARFEAECAREDAGLNGTWPHD